MTRHAYQVIEENVSSLHGKFRKTLDKFTNDWNEVVFVGNSREFLEDIA